MNPTPLLPLGRRTLASPFVLTNIVRRPASAATRARSTLAASSPVVPTLLARPVRPTSAAVSTTTCARARSTLATPWLPRPTRPSTTAPSVPAAARARSTLATPWLPRPTRPSAPAPSVPFGARARSTLATPWLPRPIRPVAPPTARFASTQASNNMTKIAIVAHAQVKPEHAEELKKRLATVAKASRAEAGTEYYQPTINAEDPTKFHVFETYRDINAVHEHASGPGLAALKAWFETGVLATPLTIEKHEIVDVE